MTPPDPITLRTAIDRFTKQGDRGTALVATAWLDDSLEARLRAALRPDKKAADSLFRPDGPTGSFSAKIELAYLLDLVERTARRDLNLLRDIRNRFAHVRTELRFTTPQIRDRCRELHAAEACRLGGWELRSPRQRFVVTAYFLGEYLLTPVKGVKWDSLRDNADSYGSWIRRTVKSSALRAVATELAAL